MKNNIIIPLICVMSFWNAQVRIGEKSITANPELTNTTSVLLEFGDTSDKGIILPYVETVPTGANDAKGGTLIFDISANSEYKVKVKNENANWTDLSVESGYSSTLATAIKNPQASPLVDSSTGKALIGAASSTTEGVLVLESADKAMVLPIVTSFSDIKNPSPGMMAFLKHPNDSTKHRLLIFNGQKWAFWKP